MMRFFVVRVFSVLLLGLPFVASGQGQCGPATPSDSEGPFYKAGAPVRESLVEPSSKGEKLYLGGRVLDTACRPVAGATLDFWQTDEKGEYDNAGYRYRGKAVADAQGRFRIETVLPAEYPGRPRHIHVKVHRPGGRVLTTQLYFPGESRGADRALVVRMEKGEGGRRAAYDFVIP